MILKYEKLENNIKYLEIPIKNVSTATIIIMFKAGSKYETKEQNGIAHFMEHMFFKGGKKYKSANEVALAFDKLGAVNNAFTSKEIVAYYATSASEFLPNTIDILSDMLLYASFPTNEINKERNVILQEYAMYMDEPRSILYKIIDQLMYKEGGLSQDIIGTIENINKFTKKDFLEYKKQYYTNENMLIVIAGNTSKINAKEIIQLKFKDFNNNTKNNTVLNFEFSDEKELSYKKGTEQAHIALAFPTIGKEHKDIYKQLLLVTMLGKGMSSRMFQNIREKQGLCYYIYTDAEDYLQKGYISTFAGVDKNKKEMAINLIKNEYKKIKTKKVSSNELNKAKNMIKGKTALMLESTIDTAMYYGSKWLLLNNKNKIEDELKKIFDINEKQIYEFANEYLIEENLKYCEVI